MGLLCAEQDVGNINKCTFRNSGTPVRRTRRRKSQKVHFQEFWDSCAQNKTSEVSTNALSGILGLLCAEQDVGSLKKCTFRISGTPVRRTRRELLAEIDFFLKKPLVPGSFAAWDRTFSRKLTFFGEATCPGQLRCLGQNFSQEIIFFEEATCPGQLRCLGQNFFSEI